MLRRFVIEAEKGVVALPKLKNHLMTVKEFLDVRSRWEAGASFCRVWLVSRPFMEKIAELLGGTMTPSATIYLQCSQTGQTTD